MSLPELLPCNPPSLSALLRCRTNELRSSIVKANYNTQFAQNASELTDFRRTTAGLVDGMEDDILYESFRKTVRFTTYDSYAPFIERFFDNPCNANTIVDLLAPGLPDYLAESSSTSGGRPKIIPKYNRTSKIKSSDTGSWIISDPLRRRTRAYIWYLVCKRMDVVEEGNSPVKTLYLTCVSIMGQRTRRYFDPEKDEEKMGMCVLDHAAPYAASFIEKWRPFLLIHALFALATRSLETIDMLFINTFVDMMRCLDMEYDMVVDSIANGTIPDLEGIVQVRHYLELNISSDPERAAELRRLGRPSSRQGWCGHAWPNLRSVTATASGCFSSSVPLAQWFLGLGIDILSYAYGSTEAYIGSPYNPLNLKQFKPGNDIVLEFLDVSKSNSISSLVQPWEVEQGRRYELVLTTEDGLWRYRLGDVIEICGFDPTDGVPIIQFVERRSVALRFPDIMITEEQLRSAVSSMLINVVNWTATIDSRCVPDTIGFFVEPSDDQDQVSDLASAPERALSQLSQLNPNVAWGLAHDVFRKPTIRLVRPGTFCDFLQLKLDEGSNHVGQIKVPVVLPKAEYVVWFLDRVTKEL